MGADRAGAGADRETARAELIHLRTESALHQRLRDLTAAFSRDATSAHTVEAALEGFAIEANALFGGRRTCIWLHARRDHQLTLSACSDARGAGTADAVRADDAETPPARGLRLEGPEILRHGTVPLLLAPLRGWRRALGTVVVEGPFGDALDDGQRVQLARELGRSLSAVIENIQLLAEVQRQRRLLEDTFDSLVDPVVVTDSSGRVVQINDAFVDRTGLTRAELIEQPLDMLVGAEVARWAASREPCAPARPAGGGTQHFELPRLDGTFAATASALINSAGEPAGRVLVLRDITEQTRLEREREALGERLAQSQKLASLGQFVAGVAHEMNNPLQAVLGHLELLIDTSGAAPPLRRELRRIFQEADRAARIVRNLLIFTGARRVSRRRLRLARVISRAVKSRSVALERTGIRVSREVPDDLPWITGDPLLLHQAFVNVLINAEHAILAAGTGPEPRIEISTRHDQSTGRLVTTFRDTGPGIDPDVLPRVFDPFFTTKEVGQGTGLGLAITYGIVQEHHGVIQAANAPEGGGLITIELPADTGPESAAV